MLVNKVYLNMQPVVYFGITVSNILSATACLFPAGFNVTHTFVFRDKPDASVS